MIAPRDPRAWRAKTELLRILRHTPQQQLAHRVEFETARLRLLGRLRLVARGIPLLTRQTSPAIGGLARRVAIAQLLAHSPGVLTLADWRRSIDVPMGWRSERLETQHAVILAPLWLLWLRRAWSVASRYLERRRSSFRTRPSPTLDLEL